MTGERLSDADLAAIEERANAATPGPWFADDEFIVSAASTQVSVGKVDGDLAGRPEHDVVFLAASREDVPRLVADLRAERAEVARLRDRLRELGHDPDE